MLAGISGGGALTDAVMLGSALMLGLATSVHCVGMCGPLALALPVTGGNRAAYVGGRLLYNLGRACTYAAMGLLAGFVGGALSMGGFQRWVSLASGLTLLLILLPTLTGGLSRWLAQTGIWRIYSGVQALWQRCGRRGLAGLFVLGAVNGLLPCGPVYVALAAALTLGDPLAAAVFMLVFGMGTSPLLLVIALAGKPLQSPLRQRWQWVIPASTALVAVLLILRGLALGIPFISPPEQATSLEKPCCCHGP